MHVLTGGAWHDGFLDEHREAESCRIQVKAWLRVRSIDGLYFIPDRDWRRVTDYVKEIGVREVLRKVRSRMAERGRNDKVLALGAGVLLEPAAGSVLAPGTPVLFIAPCHPGVAERVVLPDALVRPITDPAWRALVDATADAVLHDAAPELDTRVGPVTIEGWHRFSGVPLDFDQTRDWLDRLDAAGSDLAPRRWHRLALPAPSPVRECSPAAAAAGADDRLRAVLFGYGHYAKTIVVPNLDARIRLDAVHEVDPLQVGAEGQRPFALDTSPGPRPAEAYDVYCIAGYHHTHAPIAIDAIARGACAVVEKPLVTTRAQLDALTDAVARGPGRFYACFHKRYSALTEQARVDLGADGARPISYHCVVYEVPLPRLHWYRWPVSRSRIVSNGCHWIDHFLFLNGFAPVRRWSCVRSRNDDCLCTIELDNDASFSMALTDHGSQRLGVRNHVELRTGRTTVQIVDDTSYVAEDGRRVIRRMRINKMAAFGRMYREISAALAAGRAIDTPETIRATAGVTLDLDDAFEADRGL